MVSGIPVPRAPVAAPPILSAQGLGKAFGKFRALSGVTVDFPEGGITAIIGPNGAGKSTFFNLISGAVPPSEGRVLFRGRDITGLPPHRFARMGIAKSFQITNVFPHLTVRENVRVAAQARNVRVPLFRDRSAFPELTERAEALLGAVGLGHRLDRLARELAHGEQRALEIAVALAAEPSLLLLDEPTAGMSPEETRAMMDLVQRLAETCTLILVEHKMKLVMGLCRRLVVLHQGQLLAEGTPDDIRAHPEVRRVYLGKSA
ncbi:ABC transporter ATP-binding protein [Methylobacterium frigidaeris]|uniref:Lipopolysaccharide export system ATP-binding protein LptB n=1 Tax=Methylobacterium frigidaeris TaxID=2038277 RepID=A0AA37HIX8_9HYPH|nr:ABC transporter ATP-binding protein [Methylobacterium frigidaeris]PIK71927.1 ABC transporter ATP-binding protein [Methylobacterium frigidaeris]GJD66000.1 Lipopolysaccharide export system ATP-binding protein LptB [Methylobacterium frigidaeris]